MTWMQATTIVVVTERDGREPVRTLLGQLERLGHDTYVIARISYETTRRLPTPHVVLIDLDTYERQTSNNSPRAIRGIWEFVPILLIGTAEQVRRMTFDPELHDFLTLPINHPELDARLRFALWKTRSITAPRDIIESGPLRMNLSTYEVWVNNRKVELTYKEFSLLKFLVSHPRRVFTRPELLETVWESDYYGGTRTVDVHVRRLRAKLGAVVGNMIRTVRNVGYRYG
jgi:DNA-binding response OmpR family regulator